MLIIGILIALTIIASVFDIGWLKTLLAVIALVLAIMFMPGIAPVLTGLFPSLAFLGAGSWVMAGALALGSWLLDPEVAGEVVDAVGEVAVTVAEAAADVAGGVISGLLKNPIVIVAGVALGYFLLKDDTPPPSKEYA